MDKLLKSVEVEFFKVDELGILFGFAQFTKKDGESFFDSDNQTMDNPMLVINAWADFMEGHSVLKENHQQDTDIGKVIFAFPMIDDIAKSLGIETEKEGIIVGVKPTAEGMKKFKSGELTNFSIGGGAVWVDI